MKTGFYNQMLNEVADLGFDELCELEDRIKAAIANIEQEKMIALKEKAMKALEEYFANGGILGYEDYTSFSMLDPNRNNDCYCIHVK